MPAPLPPGFYADVGQPYVVWWETKDGQKLRVGCCHTKQEAERLQTAAARHKNAARAWIEERPRAPRRRQF